MVFVGSAQILGSLVMIKSDYKAVAPFIFN